MVLVHLYLTWKTLALTLDFNEISWGLDLVVAIKPWMATTHALKLRRKYFLTICVTLDYLGYLYIFGLSVLLRTIWVTYMCVCVPIKYNSCGVIVFPALYPAASPWEISLNYLGKLRSPSLIFFEEMISMDKSFDPFNMSSIHKCLRIKNRKRN